MLNIKGFMNKDMTKESNKLFDLQIDTIENDLLVIFDFWHKSDLTMELN